MLAFSVLCRVVGRDSVGLLSTGVPPGSLVIIRIFAHELYEQIDWGTLFLSQFSLKIEISFVVPSEGVHVEVTTSLVISDQYWMPP